MSSDEQRTEGEPAEPVEPPEPVADRDDVAGDDPRPKRLVFEIGRAHV